MTGDLREKVEEAVNHARRFGRDQTDAAIRAVLEHYAENGPTLKMVAAGESNRLRGEGVATSIFKAMMRAALEEKGKSK